MHHKIANLKPLLEHLPPASGESFVVRSFDYAYYPTPWHFHPEYELVLVTESSGRRFIGDSIADFKPGDLALIGPDLPHLYRNDVEYYRPRSGLRAKSIVIHFLEGSFGSDFFSVPEVGKIKVLLEKAARGIDIFGKTNRIVSEKMQALCGCDGFRRWLGLLEILYILSETREWKYISNANMQGRNGTEIERMNSIFDFVMKNFKRDIHVGEVAALVNLAPNSFSRYFSLHTRKTFTSFVNEVRLHHASQLLIEDRMSVIEICFDCGFNNVSHFNRQFRNVYHTSPLNYRKQYLNKV